MSRPLRGPGDPPDDPDRPPNEPGAPPDDPAAPPRLWRALLSLFLAGGTVGASIRGDLDEEYRRRAQRDPAGQAATTDSAADLGPGAASAARHWYRREALSLIGWTVRRLATGAGRWDRGTREGGAGNDHERNRRGEWAMVGFWRDIVKAARALARVPGFTAVTVITIALGIGANAAIFSVVDGVLLEPLGFEDEDRLVNIASRAPGLSLPPVFGVSPEFYTEYAGQVPGLEDLGIYRSFDRTLQSTDGSERIRVANASASLFSTLGTQPVLGRAPTQDELVVGEPGPVVISHGLWQRRFAGDPSVLDRTIDIAGTTRPVIGVMGPDFEFPDAETEAWLADYYGPERQEFGNFAYNLVGRVAPEVTPAQMATRLKQVTDRFPETYASFPQYVSFLEQGQYRPVVESLREQAVGDLRQPLLVLLGTVGVLLLIACANVANLLLVRGEARQRETAVRAAMGATRGRLIRGALAEALVLAAVGGALGTAIAAGGVPALVRMAPDGIPRVQRIDVDPDVLLFVGAVALLAALLFGLLPALRGSSPRVLARLRESGRRTTGGREGRLARDVLVVAQTGMALVLLVASGLLIRSFWDLRGVDPGFEAEEVLIVRTALGTEAYPDAGAQARFHEELSAQLSGLPGVERVAVINDPPLLGSVSGSAFEFEGSEDQALPIVYFTYASPSYFETLGIGLEGGRTFSGTGVSAGEGEALVSRAVAERHWPGQDPIGRRLRFTGDTTGWETVVGVVGDVRDRSLREEPEGMVYLPLVPRQGTNRWSVPAPAYAIQGRNPSALIPLVRDRLRQLDPTLPLYAETTLESAVADSEARLTFTMTTLLIAAGMALVLGAVGLYGVLSYLVTQRTHEIGVRLALGARADQVRRMVVAQGTRLAVIGIAVGVLGAAGVTRLLQGLLYGTEPMDLNTYVATSGVMLGIALLASYVPARRASAVDPMESMRSD